MDSTPAFPFLCAVSVRNPLDTQCPSGSWGKGLVAWQPQEPRGVESTEMVALCRPKTGEQEPEPGALGMGRQVGEEMPWAIDCFPFYLQTFSLSLTL